MNRISLPNLDKLSAALKHQYSRFPANVIKTLLLCPTSVESFISLGRSFRNADISDFDREFVILRTARLCECEYEVLQHEHLAIQAGISSAIVDKILRDTSTRLDERLNALLNFVDGCCRNIKASDEVFFSLKRFYTDRQLATLTLLVGFYTMTAIFVRNLGTPLDTAPTSWDTLMAEK